MLSAKVHAQLCEEINQAQYHISLSVFISKQSKIVLARLDPWLVSALRPKGCGFHSGQGRLPQLQA